MSALIWRPVTPSNSPKFLVKGSELNVAICGQHSRFQICEIRARDEDGFADRRYVVRDAESVTDAQVKDGVRPAIVASFETLDEAIAYCDSFTVVETEEEDCLMAA